MAGSLSNHSTESNAPDDNEMFDSIEKLDEQIMNNANHFDSTNSYETVVDKQQSEISLNSSSPTSHKKFSLAKLKNRLHSSKHEYSKTNGNDNSKNTDFLLVNQVDADPILISNENIDSQHTRHAETCENEETDGETINLNQIQILSPSPNLNQSNNENDVQATQASVECATPIFKPIDEHESQISTTNSSTSTNSSNNDQQLTTADRSKLNDDDYISAQKHDLERITIYEISLNNERRDYQQDLPQNENDELDFNIRYNDELQKNLKLTEQLKGLQDEKTRIYSPWSCELCTYFNKPFAETGKNVCEVCEGPSPLKRHTLTS